MLIYGDGYLSYVDNETILNAVAKLINGSNWFV